MTDLIVVRLHPGEQTDPDTFTAALAGLQITAFDLTVADPGQPVQIGTASGLAAPPAITGGTFSGGTVDLSSTQIIQHWLLYIDGIDPKIQLESAATAVIEVSAPAGHPEYPTTDSVDVQLVITRNGVPIPDPVVEYNAAVVRVATPSPDQVAYFGASSHETVAGPTSPGTTYVTIPPAPPAGAQPPALLLPADGTPPSFDDLKQAIDGVLADDPGGTDLVTYTLAQGQLSAAQCQQIGAEIIWNRGFSPAPDEPADYGLLYTSDPASALGVKAQDEDSTRQQFEGKVSAYHATNDALASRLAGYVFAASAAVLAEQTSAQATTAGFPFPLITGTDPVVDTEVELTGVAAGSFAVPAAYFYALATALAAQITSDQRYHLAVFAPEDKNLQQFTAAAAASVIGSAEGFVTPGRPASTINANQAARRLSSLGAISGSLPAVNADADVTVLVNDWLGYPGVTATIDTGFWAPEVGVAATVAHQAEYLDLVLQVVTGEPSDTPAFTSFRPAISAPPLAIASVSQLAHTSDQAWQTFFLANPGLLPPFTAPGTTVERIAAFVRHLQKFFTTPIGPVQPSLQSLGQPDALGRPGYDVLAVFAQNYAAEGGGTFAFGSAWDATAVTAAVAGTLPGDAAAQAWLTQALNTIEALYQLTAFAATSSPDLSELRFSLMEALYTRGFTTAAGVAALAPEAFQAALDGTVAYPYAGQIQTAAGGSTASASPPGAALVPVNPDGSLTNCVPPPHLSPFGPVAYLDQMLRASAASTPERPEDPEAGAQIGTLLTARRGPLGNLHATGANLETPLPVLDLVNESLEALAAAVATGAPGTTAGGAVFDTGDTEADAFTAIPEHSSPAAVDTPTAQTDAYAALRTDFTAPVLPYDQPLDLCRSYLCRMRTSRFAAMRRFRKDITEFVLDPAVADEPPGFQRHLWRRPVRFEAALEFLGISAPEYARLFQQPVAGERDTGQLAGWELYGFPAAEAGDVGWTDVVTVVPEFLRRTGLSYCELVELQRSGFVPFTAGSPQDRARAGAGDGASLPECEPCGLDDLRLEFPGSAGDDARQDPAAALYELIVFIRLWRRLRERAWCDLTFAALAKVTTALGLFSGTAASPVVNPDFPRQLAALLMLRDDLRLDPIELLPLWAVPPGADWARAVSLLLSGVERHARSRWSCREREPEFITIISSNLDPLSRLAGFDPDTPSDTWHTRPAHTLRFAEVLGKIYASAFTVGEILFLFTGLDHLDGDDPFPLPDADEATDDPLALPEADPAAGDGPHSLWALRRALLRVEADEDAAREWSWPRIVATLREEFGFLPPSAGTDPLTDLAEHFFPSVLECDGHVVSQQARQYRTGLDPADTSPQMWNAGPGPFRYDVTAKQLWMRLPLRDGEVITRLQELPQLQPAEQAAVRQLYFAARATLGPFGIIFENFPQALNFLVAEDGEEERFAFFQRQFARFHRRCRLIARHLAAHVDAVLGRSSEGGEDENRKDHDDAAAWRVLRSLLADGNLALGPWEDDSGQPPAVTWGPRPSGGAFAALLGLCGTGLLGEFTTTDADPAWRETRGPLSAFGDAGNEHNCPVPTVLPALDLALTPQQLRQAGVRNGFALRDTDGEPLGGAEPFTARWTGTLLVERGGEYRFHAGAPGECEPDFDAARRDRWRVTLRRGDKTWVVLSHCHGEAHLPPARSLPLTLRRGAYQITAEYQERGPLHAGPEELCPERTGFEVAYCGPDTRKHVSAIPLHRLFRPVTGASLGSGLQAAGSAAQFLDGRYSPGLRDIRRTYQRAFKALLFAERFGLSARRVPGGRQSELGYLLDHPQTFEGTSYYRTGASTFATHHAWFDPDLLPVADPYPPSSLATDQRGEPSPRRQAALFDWWERIFDYCWLREQTAHGRQRPVWLLFAESARQQPDDAGELLRHLGVDLRHAPLVLTYFDVPEYPLGPGDLQDERWAVRVWHAETWLRRLEVYFTPCDLGTARPDLWASDDPGVAAGAVTGNANLTGFVQDGYLRGRTQRRYAELTELNDGLRGRARAALAGYLCAMNRVALPWAPGQYARQPGDLSGLLLQDAQAGPRTRMSRIEDAVRAVQAFVQRARLGLEPGFAVTPAFARLWETRFASFGVWQAVARRETYLENWIEWDDLRAARRVEAFRLLEQQLRRSTLTVAVPGGGVWWPGSRPPGHPSLEVLQDRELATSQQLPAVAAAEGLGLLGAQQRIASPAWLAPVPAVPAGTGTGDGGAGTGIRAGGKVAKRGRGKQASLRPDAAAAPAPGTALPLWLQAAATLGTGFVRVAAAGIPPASAHFTPYDTPAGCCEECDGERRPVVDEYYFWLADSRYFLDTDVTQQADAGGQDASLPADASSAWEDPAQLPGMLVWPPEPMVHLYWSRVRHGEFEPPRRSAEGLPVSGTVPAGQGQLVLAGRTADSLRFTVANGAPPAGATADTTAPGFRYDLAEDAAVPLPLITQQAPPSSPPDVYAGLPAYPYFAYVRPGTPVEPLSPYSVAAGVAGALRTHGHFEAALKWYELAYSPLSSDDTWAVGSAGGVAVAPAVARNRAILLTYLETLLQWGDATACRTSPETAEQAKVIFETLARVLGDGPVAVLAHDDGAAPMSLSAFTPRPAPLNPRLVSLYERCADRLALVRQRLDGYRLRTRQQRHDPPFWGEDRLRNGWREVTGRCDDEPGREGLCQPDEGLCCCGPYRFTFVVQKALELAGEARSLAAGLLSAYEKGDAETLAALHATHDRQIAELTLAARQYAWREADWQVQALGLTKQGAQARLRYYQQLLAAGLNAGETSYQALTGVSIQDHASANDTEALGQVMQYIPDFAFGVAGLGPYESTQVPVGTKLAGTFSTLARIITTEAEMAGINGGLNLTQAGWDRRVLDWQLQVETLGIEIDQIQDQILAAQRHRDSALRELNIQQQQIEHAIEVQDFLRDKFTNDELCLYLQQETAALYRQAYDLALHAARRAQRAFNRERGHTARRFLPEPGWENLHEALLAGERLQVAVRQMETAYLDLNCREYELTKHLSLRLDFPLAFLHLRQAGWAEIDVPEWMFDLDYPGHYMRRIRNLTVTIPCVTGPYTGVHAKLTLLSSMTRVDPRLAGPLARCCPDRDHRDGGCGCAGRCGDCRQECGRCGCDRGEPLTGYLAEPGDPRIVREYAATQAIATSSGQNDAGLHELSFSDARYLPFEFAGAVCRLRIELPQENNRFDLDTVSDLVIHLNYTAREGGDTLRRAASEQAQRHLPGAGVRFLDVRHDLPEEWARLRRDRQGALLPLRLGREHFPFLPCHRDVRISSLALFFEVADPGCVAGHVVRFVTEHEREHGSADDCQCAGWDIECAASAEWPRLFHGVLECELPPLRQGRPHDLGDLRLPLPGDRIRQMFLVLGYQAVC